MLVTNAEADFTQESIHGTTVADPFRWLEDGTSPRTRLWIGEQQGQCDHYFAQCTDLPHFRQRVREYLDVEVVDQPCTIAGHTFYRRRGYGEEQGSLYVRDGNGTDRRLVDAAPLGPYDSIGIYRISDDSSLLAYERKSGGTNRKSIHFVDVVSGMLLPDFLPEGLIRGIVFDLSREGFYYCHEQSDPSNEHAVRFRRFGDVEPDEECFRMARSQRSRLTLIGDQVHLAAVCMDSNDDHSAFDVWIAERATPTNWNRVLHDQRVPFCPMVWRGHVYAMSYSDVPEGELVEVDLHSGLVQTIVPPQGGSLRQVLFVDDQILANHLDGSAYSISRWGLDGDARGSVLTIGEGTIDLLPSLSDGVCSAFISCESFQEPPTISEWTPTQFGVTVWNRRQVPPTCPACRISTDTFASKDGTEIPITVASPRTSSSTGPLPLLMTGYGGFGAPVTPRFSVLVAVLMELGCGLAIPHIRGGGEFGQRWHDAGRRQQRPAAFADFIAAAEWLCVEGLTSQSQLAIFGGSNAGLLVGVAMTQRPDLFRAVLCIAPLLDMVRFEALNPNANWLDEYGTVQNRDDFQVLHDYSPYHHVDGMRAYPSVLFVSGDRDERCNPAHVRKMAARLQEGANPSPVLVDYSEQRGHAPVLPLSVRVEALARRVAFLSRELGLSVNGGRSA